MRSRTSSEARAQKLKPAQGDGPNWVLLVGGALLSTITIRLGFKLKQALDWKQQDSAILKGNERSADRRSLGNCRSHSSLHSFGLDENNCLNCASGGENAESKNLNGQILMEPEVSLPLVTVPPPEYGMAWVSSPEHGEPLPKPFHQSSNSDSPCFSDSGSDIFSKREVIQKLRQQLKRRDDMILEMQDQIMELQNALSAQVSLSNNLQSQLDSANRELFESEREIQRLRKAIADHCVAYGDANGKLSSNGVWTPEGINGYTNGCLNGDGMSELAVKSKGDERIDMLKKEIGELREVIEDKEFLLQSYKEQKAEFSSKIKELQQRLDSQLPHIL